MRVREQVASNLLGLHVQANGALVTERLTAYAGAVQARSDGPADAAARAASLLGSAVRQQASVLSYIDGFTVMTFTVIGMLGLAALLREPPVPG